MLVVASYFILYKFYFIQNLLQNTDGGLYVGLAGGGYMMLYLSQMPGTDTPRQTQYLQEALSFLAKPIQYIQTAGSRQHITDRTGFLTGNVGIMAVAAVVHHKLGQLTIEIIQAYFIATYWIWLLAVASR